MSQQTIEINRRSDGDFVEANLYGDVLPSDLLIVEREWGPIRSQLLQELLAAGTPEKDRPESLHWDWSYKAPELKLLDSNGFGIVCEKQWQAVMLTKTSLHSARIDSDKGRPLVYIDYLEVAPWNWPLQELGRVGMYRGLGSILFWQAIVQSTSEGFHGRVGLHSLPQAERFYREKCGMTCFGLDSAKQNLPYFELSREQAAEHLKNGGAI